jgi:hypothetical protein
VKARGLGQDDDLVVLVDDRDARAFFQVRFAAIGLMRIRIGLFDQDLAAGIDCFARCYEMTVHTNPALPEPFADQAASAAGLIADEAIHARGAALSNKTHHV